MAIGDILTVTLFQDYRGELAMNVWDYEHTAGATNDVAVLLRGVFDSTVLEVFDNVQTTGVLYTRLLVQNRMRLADNTENLALLPAGGAQAANGLPGFVAASIRSARPDLSKRYSYKRIVGIPYTAIEADGSLTATYLADLQSLADAMETVLVSSGNSFTPIQAKRTQSLGTVTYTRNYFITSWIAQEEPTTQNSRKKGHGD